MPWFVTCKAKSLDSRFRGNDEIQAGADCGFRSPTRAGWRYSPGSPTGSPTTRDQPDEGVWETRGGRKDFTYGRFQCSVALDRALRMAERNGKPANVIKWAVERDRLYNQIMSRGWNDKVGAFAQHYESDVLDSSLLFMPLQGFISPTETRCGCRR